LGRRRDGFESAPVVRLRGTSVRALALAAWFVTTGCARTAAQRTWIEPVTGIEFVWIPPGSFRMGSPPGEPEDVRPAPVHEVRLTHGFWMARTEVTQAEWQRVMGDNPSWFPECGPRCPVERVNWYDVRSFIERLRQRSDQPGLRLPTEAEWEYACRAGTTTAFSTGADLTTGQANYDGRMPYPGRPEGGFRGGPTPVASFAPNPWGLYDMHGNVWEWTEDEYCPYATGPVTDPIGACGSGIENIRGGSWYFSASSARCGRRYTHKPEDRGFSIGFRLVRAG